MLNYIIYCNCSNCWLHSYLHFSYLTFLSEILPPEATETDVKNEVSDILREITPRQKPVPKKRTKLYKLQSAYSDTTSSVSTQSFSTSSGIRSSVSTQSASTSSTISSPMSTASVSTQSISTNSEIKSPPPRGILKHSSSYSSNDSNIKSQLPQPLHRFKPVSTDITLQKTFEEQPITKERTESPLIPIEKETLNSSSPLKSTLPKSRLPVRSPVPLNTSEQKVQEKPKIQPRLSLSSNTRSDDEQKSTDVMNIVEQKHDYNSTLNWVTPAEPEKQKRAVEMKEEPPFILRTTARSPMEALLNSPLNERAAPQITLHKLKEENSKLSKNEKEKAQEQQHHLQNTAGMIKNFSIWKDMYVVL